MTAGGGVSKSISTTMTARQWAMLVVLSLLWGGSFFFNGVALRELPIVSVVVGRLCVASLLLLALLRATGAALPRDLAIWRAFFAMGLLNNVAPFSLIVWGQSHIASGLAAILNATTPLFAILLAARLTRDERPSAGRLIGALVGFCGVALMVGGEAARSSGADIAACAACLAAALSYAFAGIYGRRFRAMGVSPLATATGQVTASSLTLLPAALLIDRPWSLPAPSLAAVAAIVGIGLFSTALAYVLYFRLLAAAGASNLLLVTLLIPVSAILLGVLFLGESLEPGRIAGMGAIGVGLALVDGRPARLLAGRRRGRAGVSTEH